MVLRSLFVMVITCELFSQSIAYANVQDDIHELKSSIKNFALQKQEIDNHIERLQQELLIEKNNANEVRYEATKNLHNYYVLEHSGAKHSYILNGNNFLERAYTMKAQKNITNALQHNLEQTTTRIKNISDKENAIKTYALKRDDLSQKIDTALEDFDELNKHSRETLHQLVKQNRNLDNLLKDIIKTHKLSLPSLHREPLVFSLPVSGVIKYEDHRLSIRTASQSIINTPARGKVTFAGPFAHLGHVVIINHGEGYTSVLRHVSHLFVQTGDIVMTGDVLGILNEDNHMDKTNDAMLIYELRYNGALTNPLVKMTGL